jgi:kynurenine formamidase
MREQTIIDLSRTLRPGMPVFPEDPEVAFAPAAALEPWRVTRLTLGTHSGTHIDAASHYIPDGPTIDAYPLERFVLPAHVVPVAAGEDQAVEWPDLAAALPDSLDGDAVLLHTGWDRHWGSPRALRHPFLSAAAAAGLVARGAGLVGTDALNVDATEGGTTHAHAALLGADVLIVENLTGLDALEPGRAYLCAFVPLRIEGADGSPVRAFAFAGGADATLPLRTQGAPLQ